MTQKLGLTKLALNEDVEQRIQALAARDGIRIEEFFIDFDKLRKGTVGDAAVSFAIWNVITTAFYSSVHALAHWVSS